MKSCLSYLGGKSRLAARIVEIIPPDHTCYCEPCAGAAWVFFCKEPSKVEVLNDADSELVTFWRVIQHHLEEFLRYYKHAVISRELFEMHKAQVPDLLTDVQRAVRYFYLQRLAFGGHTTGRTFAATQTRIAGLNLSTIESDLLDIHWRLRGVTIEHLDACACIERYDRQETLFYIDPPYHKTAGYAVAWGESDYARLRDTLARIKGRFILSLNDHPDVRSWFSAHRIDAINTRYSTGLDKSIRSKPAREVIITNFDTHSSPRSVVQKSNTRKRHKKAGKQA